MSDRRAARLTALIVPPALIVLIALGYLAGSQLAAAEFPPEPPLALVLSILMAQAAALVTRTRQPWVALLLTLAGHVWLLLVSHGELSVGAIAMMLAVYHLAVSRPGRTATLALVAITAGLIVVSVVALSGSIVVPVEWRVPAAIAQSALVVGVPFIIGEIVVGRRRLVAALHERATLAEQAREFAEQARARDAVAAAEHERTQIARELHDIAAHHLTGIILSTQAAKAVAASDPAASRAHSETAAREARLALDGIRATVGLLRTGTDAERAPLPGYDDIAQLIDEVRARGTDVVFTPPPPTALGAAASLATYRTVQESLANARAHAPGAVCEVRIDTDAEWLRVTVTNTAPSVTASTPASPTGQGLGLVGMRERAQLLGGAFTAGSTADGGWQTLLRLPLTQEEFSR